MGLSASQTRYLSLTARKSNVEYQGQQINQQRTTLANQSSALYTEMMTLKAPTAPSVYTYVINPPLSPSIDWTQANPLENVDMENFNIYYAANQPSFKSFNIAEYKKNEDGTFSRITYDEKGNKQIGDPVTEESLAGTTYTYSTKGYSLNGDEYTYSAIHVSDDANYKYNKTTGFFEGIDENVTNADLPSWIQAYNLAMSQYSKFSKPTKTALYASTEDAKTAQKTETPQEYAVAYKFSSSIGTNQAQYDAAMVEYEKDLEEYNKALDEINAKTEEIHEADKKLELQLKQLDTEQEAITNEMEAVKKVIDKNIENTFKSFA